MTELSFLIHVSFYKHKNLSNGVFLCILYNSAKYGFIYISFCNMVCALANFNLTLHKSARDLLPCAC